MEHRSSWAELLIVVTIIIAIFGVTSFSSRALIQHAKNRMHGSRQMTPRFAHR
jgi:hypothetical protein